MTPSRSGTTTIAPVVSSMFLLVLFIICLRAPLEITGSIVRYHAVGMSCLSALKLRGAVKCDTNLTMNAAWPLDTTYLCVKNQIPTSIIRRCGKYQGHSTVVAAHSPQARHLV